MLKNKKVKTVIQSPSVTQSPVPQKDEETNVTLALPVEETLTKEIEYSIDDTRFISQSPSPIYNPPIIGTVIRINTTKQTIIIEDSFHNGIELPISPLNKHNKVGFPYTEYTEYSQKEEV